MDETTEPHLCLGIWVFSGPLPQEYEIKCLAMQSAFTNICKRMGSYIELVLFKSESQQVILWNGYAPRSSTINYRWYYCKVGVFRDCSNSVTKCHSSSAEARKSYRLSANSITGDVQTSSGIKISTKCVQQELHSKSFQLHDRIITSTRWIGVSMLPLGPGAMRTCSVEW